MCIFCSDFGGNESDYHAGSTNIDVLDAGFEVRSLFDGVLERVQVADNHVNVSNTVLLAFLLMGLIAYDTGKGKEQTLF